MTPELRHACEKIIMLDNQIADLHSKRDEEVRQQQAQFGVATFNEAFVDYEVEQFENDPAWGNIGRGEMK